MTVARVLLNSTALTSVSFSVESNLLEVEFRNGLIYEYLGVSGDLYQQLLAAPSHGAFLVHFIRNRFAHRRVERPAGLTQ